MELSPNAEMRKITDLSDELFKHVLSDEAPLFISDEATIWDVTMISATELLSRLQKFYAKPVAREQLSQPLWRLLRQLNEGRRVEHNG